MQTILITITAIVSCMSSNFRETYMASRSPDKNDVKIGIRIRERRQQVGLTQRALGEHVGVTFQQIQKYEVGSNRVSVGRLSKIAAVLDVPQTFFFDREPRALHLSANDGMTFLSAEGALRLIKAYNRMTPETRGHFAKLVEQIAEKLG